MVARTIIGRSGFTNIAQRIAGQLSVTGNEHERPVRAGTTPYVTVTLETIVRA